VHLDEIRFYKKFSYSRQAEPCLRQRPVVYDKIVFRRYLYRLVLAFSIPSSLLHALLWYRTRYCPSGRFQQLELRLKVI